MKIQPAQMRTAAFTLVELMVVVVIIGILAATIVPRVVNSSHEAKINAAKGSVAELSAALERFYVHLDRYPTTEEGLKVLLEAPSGDNGKWRGPHIEKLHNDPWGNPYQYRAPGAHRTSSYDIWSRGADGQDGGDGDNADIGNW